MGRPVPESYLGLWRRSVLVRAGRRDVESCVFWLQTRTWHGDLRIAPGRPDFGQTNALQECTREQLLWLLQQEGFAGITRVEGDICEWQRVFDYRPTGLRDIGRMVCSGPTIEEYGLEQEYFERWVRETFVNAHYSARQSMAHSMPRLLLSAGDQFMYLRPRAIDQAETRRLWAELGAGRVTEDEMRLLADFEISFGAADDAARRRILHSTLPWREGCVLCIEGQWVDMDVYAEKMGEENV
jgi:hypothetical protein